VDPEDDDAEDEDDEDDEDDDDVEDDEDDEAQTPFLPAKVPGGSGRNGSGMRTTGTEGPSSDFNQHSLFVFHTKATHVSKS
jgi:nucleosome assembly protein 1-like 1